MPDDLPTTGSVTATLTDGTGVSSLTSSKLIKDAVVDFLMGLPPALLAVNIAAIPTDRIAFVTAAIAVGGVLMGVAYRTALKWATS